MRSEMQCLKIYLLLNGMMLIYMMRGITRWQANGATLGHRVLMLVLQHRDTLGNTQPPQILIQDERALGKKIGHKSCI